MANNSNERNRNHSGSNRQWDNDDNRHFQNRNFENERNQYRSGQEQNRDNYSGNDNDRYRGDNEWGSSRGMYGNSESGYRGSGNDSGRNTRDWSNKDYPGSDYDRQRYSNDRGRNQDEDRNWWNKTKDEVSSWFGSEDAEQRRRMDEKQGEHKGKGPRGYTRSDDRIKEDVNDRLSEDSHIDASEIDVSVEKGEVTLSGTVNTRWEKRHAEDLTEALSGVKNVENRLKVSSNSNANTGSGTASTGTAGATYGAGKTMPNGAYESSKS